MAVITRPKRWGRQQPPVAHLDRNHPLTQGLICAAILNGAGTPIDLVTGKRITASAQKQGPTAIGQSSLFDGTTGTTASIPLDLSTYNKITVAFWLQWDAFANDDLLALEHTSNYGTNAPGFLFDPNSGAPDNGFFQIGMSTTGPVFAAGHITRPSAGVLHHIVTTFDRTLTTNAGGVRVWVDGVEQSFSVTSNNIVGGNFGNSTLYVMSRNSTSLLGKGRMPLLSIYNRNLTVSEIQRLYADPWAYFQAQAPRQRYWLNLPGSTVPATVTAPTATATADTAVPTVTAKATVAVPTATATAAGVVPTVTAAATVTAVTASATCAGIAPTVSGRATVTAPTSTASAAAITPTVTARATVTATTATATATGIAPIFGVLVLRDLTYTIGQPYTEWAAGTPFVSWTAGVPARPVWTFGSTAPPVWVSGPPGP